MNSSQPILETATGWFELGNYVEAFNELDNLPPEHRASVEAMELRCHIYRKLERWQELEIVAAGCSGPKIEQIPFACHHAWALLKQGRISEAEAALDAMPYTCAPELLFTRACVPCAKRETERARTILADAITFSLDSNAIKLRALEEPMLEKVWRDEERGG